MPDHASDQPLPEWVTWDCCDQLNDDGTPCTGAAQSDYGRCLVHLDDTQLVEVMAPQPDEAAPDLDARGVRFATGELERVLTAAGSEDRLPLHDVSLRRATVEGNVSLDWARVNGSVSLGGATVDGDVSLSMARVNGSVSLRGATVNGYVSLHLARVDGDVNLGGATVAGVPRSPGIGEAWGMSGVSLREATIKGDVFLPGATVNNDVSLGGARVNGDVSLRRATVNGDVFLANATVNGGVFLAGATVNGGVTLHRATVDGDLSLGGSLGGARVNGVALLGPMSATRLSLVGTEFTRLASLDVTAKHVELSRARLLGGLTARVGGAEVLMRQVEVHGPAVLAVAHRHVVDSHAARALIGGRPR